VGYLPVYDEEFGGGFWTWDEDVWKDDTRSLLILLWLGK
jgi:hypothetical protein